MESHPSYPALSQYITKYARASGCIFQTYNDLLLAQQWDGLEIIELPNCSRVAFQGRRPNTDLTLSVVPCSIAESISLSWLDQAFRDLQNPKEMFLAITADDSSTVYYKLSPGFVKPPL